MNGKKFRMDKNIQTVRRSQLITTFGVGSIVDLPDLSVMVRSTDSWDTKRATQLNDERLAKRLGVKMFLAPPDEKSGHIESVIFPRWFRCPHRDCGRLNDIEVWRNNVLSAKSHTQYKDFDSQPYCYRHNLKLIPSRFIVGCVRGHIDDFPYAKWVHDGDLCAAPDLYYKKGAGSTLTSIKIRCGSCTKIKSLAGATKRGNIAKFVKCSGTKPWEKHRGNEGDCELDLRFLLRGGSNTYFPVTRSSILIPGFTGSPTVQQELMKKIVESEAWQMRDLIDRTALVERLSAIYNCSPDDVTGAISLIESGDDAPSEENEANYRYPEYRSFTEEGSTTATDNRDFVIERKRADEYMMDHLKSVVLVKKLRELRAQVGFTRIRPPLGGEEAEESEQAEQVSVVSRKYVSWLPAYEVRGEGIFIEFDGALLNEWAGRPAVSQRYKKLMNRFNASKNQLGIDDGPTPQFVFLHSFAHAFIRQLSYECGYSSSSLRERVYASTEEGTSMNGVLIYTADGDADGTLGGLVRQGEPDRLRHTIINSIRNSAWCSTDPLCIDSHGQGYAAVNLGACHSCLLLPETSCEFMNGYLDRAAIAGTPEHKEMSFFSDVL